MRGQVRWMATISLLGAIIATALPASAATAAIPPPGTTGSFPTWTAAKTTTGGHTYTGSASFSAAAAFPGVSFSTDASTVRTPSGDSAFLGASTGFGQYFGTSRSQPYLYLSPAAGGPSTTTITFDGPPPPGWGLAVGDIDADFVEVIPRDAGGAALPGTDLVAQNTNNVPPLNYCQSSPKPSGCSGPGPFTDVPGWFENGTTIGGTVYTTPVVKGTGADTFGAYDWFLPGSDVRSVTLVFHVLSGFPIYQLWLAASAPVATIAGTVTPTGGGDVPDGTSVVLVEPDGTAITGLTGDPITVPVPPDGSFSIQAEEARYRLEFDVPAGFAPIAPIPVDARTGSVDLGTIALAPASTSPVPPVPPVSPGNPSGPTLARTGTDAALPLTLSVAALAAGVVLALTGASRRRRPRGRP